MKSLQSTRAASPQVWAAAVEDEKKRGEASISPFENCLIHLDQNPARRQDGQASVVRFDQAPDAVARRPGPSGAKISDCRPYHAPTFSPRPQGESGFSEAAVRPLVLFTAALLAGAPSFPGAWDEQQPGQGTHRSVAGWLQSASRWLERLENSPSAGEVNLALEPAGLGRVEIRAQWQDGTLNLRFFCDLRAAERIERSLQLLVERLEILGSRVGQVELRGARELMVRFGRPAAGADGKAPSASRAHAGVDLELRRKK